MHPVRKQRLIMVVFIVVFSSVGVALTLFALSENMNMFYPPSKIVAGEAPLNKTIRVGGCVVYGSVIRDPDSLKVDFSITDGANRIPARYEGLLPDLFAEGDAAVLIGQIQQDGVFLADKVLAKHDENYTPPEVADIVQTEEGTEQHEQVCEAIKYDS